MKEIELVKQAYEDKPVEPEMTQKRLVGEPEKKIVNEAY